MSSAGAKKTTLRTIVRMIILIIILAFIGCNVQNYMLYYPDKRKPSPESLTPYHIHFWGETLDDYRGYVSTVPHKTEGTVIVFHGNAGGAVDRAYYIQALAPLGYRVLLAEYPGYGGRKGKLGEKVFVPDARETIRLAVEQFGEPVFLLGESLGCGVAAAAARDSTLKIKGLILITPWDSLLSVAKAKFPFLPVRLFLTDQYDSIQNLKSFKGRIAVAGAEQDEILPVHHARTLYEALPENKKWWMIKGAGHNDWFDFVGQGWWQEVMEFVACRGLES